MPAWIPSSPTFVSVSRSSSAELYESGFGVDSLGDLRSDGPRFLLLFIGADFDGIDIGIGEIWVGCGGGTATGIGATLASCFSNGIGRGTGVTHGGSDGLRTMPRVVVLA